MHRRKPSGDVDPRPWCQGFYAAMRLKLSAWAPLLDASNVNHYLLLPILLHCRDDQGRPLLGPPRSGRETKNFLRNTPIFRRRSRPCGNTGCRSATPALADHCGRGSSYRLLLIGVWCVAIFGIVLKLTWPGRFDRLATGLYLALGWSGIMLYDSGIGSLPKLALWYVVTGGALYTLGVIFHAWQRLRFQNVIWHCFVLLGAACHYTAVMDLVLT